jgi:hypothetical protein
MITEHGAQFLSNSTQDLLNADYNDAKEKLITKQ